MIKKVILVLFGIIISILLCLNVLPYFQKVDNDSIEGSANWMKNVNDELLLSDINIPGTHNAATQYIELPFFSRCQDLSISEQLEAGYRYLDIRLAMDENKLQLMHSFTKAKTDIFPWSQDLLLENVLKACYQFLEDNPSETVLFSVRKEHGDESIEVFQTLLNEYIISNVDAWYLSNQVPTLKDARGKIVLLRRYDDEANLGVNAGIPMYWNEKTTQTLFENHIVSAQDQYELNTDEKWDAFNHFLKNVKKEKHKQVIINFLSTKGSFTYGHPYYFASQLNRRLLDTKLKQNTKYGWIIVDFADARLARHIYATNDD